jgi:hypothetical protein
METKIIKLNKTTTNLDLIKEMYHLILDIILIKMNNEKQK